MSLEIQNFGVVDPFSNDTARAGEGGATKDLIHIRNQQRNGRKSVTTIQGLGGKGSDMKTLRKIVRALKKEFSCNGTVIDHVDFGFIIQLQGDKRHVVKDFLEREQICGGEQIRIHGA